MPNPWLILGALVFWAASVAGAWQHGYGSGKGDEIAKQTAEALERTNAARETERIANRDRARIDDAKNQEVRSVRDRLSADLERLRDTHAAERLPEPARAACKGATGAELSRPDAGVLERLAARADELRAELGACQDREWAVYQALTAPK